MILDNIILDVFQGQITAENIVEFIGDNDEKVIYNSDNSKWSIANYFKIIDFNNVIVPTKLFLFSNIQEAIFFFNNWEIIKNRDIIIVISSTHSIHKLLEFIYERIILFEVRNVEFNFFQRENTLDGIFNLININNFYTSDKIIVDFKDKKMTISNNSFISMPVDTKSFQQFLTPFIKILFQLKTIKSNQYSYHLMW
jgi:hypothetical protein